MNRILFLALAALGCASSTITDCGKGATKFAIDGLAYWPDPPIPGQNGTLSFLYTVPDGTEAITDGTAKYTFTLNGIPFTPSTDPLCDDVPALLFLEHLILPAHLNFLQVSVVKLAQRFSGMILQILNFSALTSLSVFKKYAYFLE